MTALKGMIAVVVALAIGVSIGAAFAWHSEDGVFLVSLGVLVVASEVFDFAVFKNSRVSISVALIFTAGVFSGLPGAVLIAAVAAVSSAVAHRRAVHKAAFNTGSLILTAAMFSGVLEAFSSTYDDGDYLAQIGPAMLAAALAYGVNSGLVTAAIAIDQRLNPATIWNENFRWLLPHYVFVGILAVLIALSYDRWEMSGLGLFLFPLALLWLLMKDRTDTVRSATAPGATPA